MTAEVAHVSIEKTRRIANLVKQGQYTLALHELVETARADENLYAGVVKNLESYIFKGDLDDLMATVEMVK